MADRLNFGAASGSTIEVRGLRDLNRAFNRMDKATRSELHGYLRDAAEPVAATAEQLAVSEISHMRPGAPWSHMRIGLTNRVVYIAPKERGRRSKRHPEIRRPNLKDLLLDKAMGPALDQNEDNVVRILGAGIDHLTDINFKK